MHDFGNSHEGLWEEGNLGRRPRETRGVMGVGEGRIKKLAAEKTVADIPSIIKELKNSPNEKKEECAHLLDVLASKDTECAVAIAKGGGLVHLIEVVRVGTDGGQIHAASTIATIAATNADLLHQTVESGAVAPLVKLLSGGSQKAQVYAAAAVASISTETDQKKEMLKAGVVPSLVRLVKADVAADAQVYASDAISNLSSSYLEAQNALHAAGAVPLLLELLKNGKAQVAAASALGKLMSPGNLISAYPPDITPANTLLQESISKEGGIPLLLALLNGMNVQGQVHAAAALANLARGNVEIQNQIVMAGGILPPLQMLTSKSPQAQAQAAGILAHLARYNRENQDKIASTNAMKPLVDLLDHTCPLEVQEYAALAITELCRDNNTNQTAAATLGSIALLVELMKTSKDAKMTSSPRSGVTATQAANAVKAEAAGAIWVISHEHESNKLAVEEARGIPPTVALLASGYERAENHAANALASLGFKNTKNQEQITGLLVAMLGAGTPKAKLNAAASLWRLVHENPTDQAVVARSGPTSDLISLLKNGTEEAHAYALWSLSLCITEGNQKTVLEDEGVDPLVSCLSSTKSITRQQAAAALARLALRNTKAQEAIAAKGGIKPLIAIIKSIHGDEPFVSLTIPGIVKEQAITAKEHAAAALAQLACVAKNRDSIVDGEGIDPLVMLLNSTDPMTQKFAAAALARLATAIGDKDPFAKVNARTIAKAGAIPSLVTLLEGLSGDAAQEESAGALFALADDDGNRTSITEAGGIGPLVMMLGSKNLQARRHAEAALVRLSIEAANRVIIIEKLVGMLKVKSVDKADNRQEQAAAALANLASDSAENRNSIVDAGGIEPLLALLESPSSKAKENSVKAIAKLAYKSKDIQTAIQKAGGVPLIANVLLSCSANVKEMMQAATLCALAANAVSQLSEGNKEIALALAEAGAVQPLVLMLGSSSVELQSEAAGAIAQLSLNSPENQAAIARTGAITPLTALVREGTAEVKEQSASALWALSYENSGNKATIAKLGGIEPLVILLVGGGSDNSWEMSVGALCSLSSKHAENRENIAKLIIGRLGSRIATVQTQNGAVRILSSVSKLCLSSSANQVAIAKAGGVPAVITWLSGSFEGTKGPVDAKAQCEAAQALLSMATGNDPLQSLIVRSHGIPPLIDLLTCGGLSTQAAAVRTLWHIAGNPDSSALIASSGGIPPLCSMLSSSDVHAQELAAIAISRMLKTCANASLIVANVGGINPLVSLLRQGSPLAQQQAVLAICEVAMEPKNRPLVADAGGIQCLGALLTSNVVGTPEAAARALGNLARDSYVTPDDGGSAETLADRAADGWKEDEGGRARRREIQQVGGIKRLIQMLQSVSLSGAVTAKKIWELVSKVIGSSPEEEGVKEKEVHTTKGKAGAASTAAADEKTNKNLEQMIGVQEQAAATLSDLAYGDSDMQDAIINEKGVPPLLSAIRTGSQISQENSSRCIWHLCAATDNQGYIVDCGAITELVALSKVGSARAQELAAAVISDLAKGAIAERERVMAEKQKAKALHAARAPSVDDLNLTSGEESFMVRRNSDESFIVREPGDSVHNDAAFAPPEPDVDDGDRLSAIAAAGGVIPLVGLVTNGNEMGKERAASALWHLSVDAVNQVAIAKTGGIPPIVQLLDDGTQQAHEHAIACLARLALDNPDNQAQIAKKLVGLLNSQNPGAQRRSAHVLWQLAANNPGAPVRIVNAGGISPLVALLGTGTIEAKEEAVNALTCLAHNNPANQLAIATGLVGLLGTGTAEAQEQVTQMLIKFASHSDNITAIVEAGAIERLVLQVRGSGETSLKAQELAASVIAILAGDSENNVKQVNQFGGIKPLVSLLACQSGAAQARAACALSYMARSSKEIQNTVAKEGAFEFLVNLLQPVEEVATGGTLDGRLEAARALYSISLNNKETTTKIYEMNAIGPLVKLLREQSPDAQKNGADALGSLAVGSKEIQDSIAKAQGITPLVEMLKPVELVKKEEKKEELGKTPKKDKKKKEKKEEEEVVPEVVSDDTVPAHAAISLSELGRNHPANQTAIAEAGGIKLLVTLLQGNSPEKTKKCAASALWSLTSNHPKNQMIIAKAGGLAPLVALLGMGNTETQHEAAGALAAIGLDNPSNQNEISTMLVGLLSSEVMQTCTKAARAISRLARAHRSNQTAIADVGGIKPLVEMVAKDLYTYGDRRTGLLDESEEKSYIEKKDKASIQIYVALQQDVASALWAMSMDNEDNQAAIADYGGLPSLIALASSTLVGVHRDAAGALWALGASPINQELIAQNDGINPLVSLLTEGSPGAQETAAGALHTLAALPDNRRLIAEAGGVPALVALFEVGTADAKVQAAGALSVLVVKNPENQSTVANCVVGLLSSETASSEAQTHATQLIYNLSLDPENRAALSKWGAINQLAKQLRAGTTSAQLNAALAMSQIALKSPQHRVQVTAQLISLLGASEAEVRQRAWNALKDMAAEGGSDNRMTVQMAGGIDRFVTLLKDGTLEAQEYALWLLWQSNDLASKKSIATAGSVKPIVALLNKGNLSEVAKEHAAAVLSGTTSDDLVAVNDEVRTMNKEAIISTGGVLPLVKLLQHGSMNAKKHTATALAQLTRRAEASHAQTQFAIANAGAISSLVGWLSDPSLGHPAIAARALADLGRLNLDTQSTIFEAGAIRPLIEMMIKDNVESQKWAAAAIASIAEGNLTNQIVVAEEGGIPPLVALLKKENGAEGKGPHENATRALWHLSHQQRENQLSIAAEGSLPPLVALLNSESDRTKMCAAAALQSLSKDCMENQLALARVGAIPALVMLLGSEDAQTQLYAQAALINISEPNQDNRTSVVNPLVSLLEVRNATAQMKAAESLAKLAASSLENRNTIAAAGAIPSLVRLLGDGRNANESQVRAAAALGDLARVSENKQAIVNAGGIEPLVIMLTSSSVEAQAKASAAVWQLSASNSAQQLIADHDGIPLLVKLLPHTHIAVANHAACALWHLTALNSSKGVIIEAGGIPLLVKLLKRTEHQETQDAISALLSDLAREKAGPVKSSIVSSGGIDHLVTLLKTGSPIAQKHASCALWGLSSEPPYQKAVVKAGAVLPLIELLTSNPKAQGYAAAALCNLANEADARNELIEQGGVDPLTAISHGPESWLRTQAVGILQRLNIEAPAALSIAKAVALKFAEIKPYYMTLAPEEQKNQVHRGWDSTTGNPRFESETGEFDHLLMSPRMVKNSYKQETKRRAPAGIVPAEPSGPLDFDMPGPGVAEALAKHKSQQAAKAAQAFEQEAQADEKGSGKRGKKSPKGKGSPKGGKGGKKSPKG